MPQKLTDQLIKNAIKHARGQTTLSDSEVPGLRIVIGPQGGAFRFQTSVRADGQRKIRYAPLGRYGEVSLAAARVAASKAKDDLRQGLDPWQERNLRRARATTLAQEAARWEPKAKKPDLAKHTKGRLMLALAEMGVANMAPSALRGKDVLRLIDLHSGHAAVARGRVNALRGLLDWLVRREVLEVNVTRTLPHGSIPGPPPARDTYPTADEVVRLWNAEGRYVNRYRDYLRLLFLVPLRKMELFLLKAGEVDLARHEIQLAAVRMKNAQPFVMPLSVQAEAILSPLLEDLRPQDRLFPTGPEWHALLTEWRQAAAATPDDVLKTKPHDLRRLFATECHNHDIGTFEDLDALLAHKASASRQGVAGIYNRSTRLPQKHRIMQDWADLLDHVLAHGSWPREQANVIPFRRTPLRAVF